MVLRTLQDLIANFAIVTAYLFLANQVIYKKWNLDASLSLMTKLHIGLTNGVLGIVLMVFTVEFNGTILDFRQLALVISALFGGLLSSLVTGLILFFVRLFAFGGINQTSIAAAFIILGIAAASGFIGRSSLSYWKKWTYSIVICNLLTIFVFYFNLGYRQAAHPALLYIIMMSLGGIFAAQLMHFLVKAKTQLQWMEQAATFDFLTELNNHRTFDTTFNATMQKAREKNEALSLLLIDIDHFKKVNDTYGHPNGDTVLKQLGRLLKDAARSFDIVSRNGGEEFSVLLYDCPHKHAMVIGERIRSSVQQHTFVLNDGQPLQMTVSVGVATYPDTKENIIEEADKALYQAKMNGRNLVCSNQFG